MKTSASFSPRHILCPVDFSDLSNLALKYAAVGAKAYDAALTVFHAERFEVPPYFTPSQVEELTRQAKTARRKAQDHLREHAGKVLGALAQEISMSFTVVDAHPVDSILDAAGKLRVDLIVLGTHGRGGAKQLWLGSVAENIVRLADVPVFVVRQKQHEFIDPNHSASEPTLRTLLCPVNFSDVAKAALQVAASIAQRFGAHLMPVCVVEPGDKRSLSQAAAELDAWGGEAVSASCLLEPASRKGNTAEQIMRLAQESKADLIVLGAQRRESAGSWLWGSTTELVLRQASMPVLIVPRAAAAK